MNDIKLIFVSIASYRDPQLLPTLRDCLQKASHPERLRFGICWQHDKSDARSSLFDDPRFRVLDVPWQASKGACWARAEVMKLWQGEDWFLQIDSHCRFASSWDEKLISVMAETGSSKPILSTYATAFTPAAIPGQNEVLQGPPLQMLFQAFTKEGIPQLRPADIPHARIGKAPLRARFLAAGFLFAPGSFVKEVPYDPDLYFMGEESAMTVRAFTHGYDLFHPAETVIWHDYIRADARKHWGDHTEATPVAKHWSELDEKSRDKVRRLLLGEPVDSFGIGPARTLQEYEAYAGLSFRHKRAQLYTVRGGEPPNPPIADGWHQEIYPFIARLRFNRAQLPIGALDDPQLWNVTVVDDEGFEVCRRDFTPTELAPLQNEGDTLALVCEFHSETVPATWTIWPMNRAHGWLRKFGGVFAEGDFAILLDEDERDQQAQ